MVLSMFSKTIVKNSFKEHEPNRQEITPFPGRVLMIDLAVETPDEEIKKKKKKKKKKHLLGCCFGHADEEIKNRR